MVEGPKKGGINGFRMQLLALSLVLVTGLAQDVEESMTTSEVISNWGYPVETYDIITTDGYILNMLRIPHGQASTNNSSCHRPPLLMLHGLMGDASEFVINPPESSPGMILADAGFDIFMLNVRGTYYSQRHVNLTKDDREYWKFSTDDIVKYDLPAAIDKSLELNGAKALYIVGHSQGTLISFMLLADLPEYNRKVRAMFELAPVGNIRYIRVFGRFLYRIVVSVKGILDFYKVHLGAHEFGLHSPRLLGGAARFVCGPLFNYEASYSFFFVLAPSVKFVFMSMFQLCRDIIFIGAGPPSRTFNFSRVPLYLSNFFVSTSTWNILQYGQTLLHNAVYHFDHSPTENLRRYGQIAAPPYNYSNIDTDVYLFWSRNDWTTTPYEIEKWIIPHMRPVVIKNTFEIPEYNHLDFVLATDCREKVFSKIIAVVREKELDACLL
ncbi:hypothetical protein PRIPAC_77503 [Pristionchus pacificus]|uniref:Lipase n=1 Tax=Pristionchus pacificus TaxID=54126 RepID=A0A2A6CLM3_PRIPA|nr:hypothetical protein PRIPAC_77503 [Pristionchus pacificus]|eukprot:PDM78988.1 hydrolase [Pristionchus pacificus]